MKQIRTYMGYTYPLDPARIFSIADMDLSYALASTPVQWDAEKQIAATVISEWKNPSDHAFRFRIRPGLKWSNGTPVTSEHLKKSFLRAFRVYPDDLRAVIKMIVKMTATDDSYLDIELNVPANKSNFLGKLTEPQYGLLYIKDDGNIDLNITTGAFFVSSESAEELTLKKNPHWIFSKDGIADEVLIRKPKGIYDHEKVLLNDTWPNMAQTFSVLPQEVMSRYKSEGYSIWTRPIDKAYLLAASRSLAHDDLLGLLQYIDKHLDRKWFLEGLSGFTHTDQLLPYGYQLHDSHYKPKHQELALPTVFKKRPVHVLCPGAFASAPQIQHIRAFLKKITGLEPNLEIIPGYQGGPRRTKGDYDFYMGSMGLADPDPEGFMSYYLEGDAPVIPPGKNKFVERLDKARQEKDEAKRLESLREILMEAKDRGYILPLFHMSTVGLARPEIDLTQVPDTDESLTLSRIRFKKK